MSNKKIFLRYKKKVNTADLILYLKLNGNISDASTSNKLTYLQNAFTYGNGLYTGLSNGSVIFNSSGQIITVDSSGGFASFGNSVTDNNFSLGCVIKPSSNGARRTLMAKGNFRDGQSREYNLELQANNTLLFMVYDQSASAYKQIVTANTFPSGNTYNIDAIYDGSLYLYVNGVLQSVTQTTSGTYTAMEVGTVRLQIGKHLSFNAYNFSGNFDDVQLWQKALSATEVANKHSLMASGIELI